MSCWIVLNSVIEILHFVSLNSVHTLLCGRWKKRWIKETLFRVVQNIFDIYAVQIDRLPVDVQHLVSEQIAHFHTHNVLQCDYVEEMLYSIIYENKNGNPKA